MTGRTASSLRAAIRSHEPARGKRYEPWLKARIIEFVLARREQRASWARVSEEVGLRFETLRRWCMASSPKPSRAMVPVRVVADAADRTVILASPAGYRVEGLTLHEAVAALRALG
ncbi:MAG TPA: hypothetical protein VGF95_12030 [Solirubrobacteraceae bacterium]|jgi:transposase-like protein